LENDLGQSCPVAHNSTGSLRRSTRLRKCGTCGETVRSCVCGPRVTQVRGTKGTQGHKNERFPLYGRTKARSDVHGPESHRLRAAGRVVELESSVRHEPYDRATWREVDLETGDVTYSESAPDWVRGDRGKVTSWSAGSRRRFLRATGAIDFEGIEKSWGGRFTFLTFTYRNDPGPEEAKRHLNLLAVKARRYIGRKYKQPLLATWKMEFQARGVVHFHLLLWLPDASRDDLAAFRRWCWSSWDEITGGWKAPDGLVGRNRVDVDWCYARDRARYIVCDFTRASKAYQWQLPDTWKSGGGRWWGMWGLKPEWKERHLRHREFIWASRLLRRHRKANSRRKPRFGMTPAKRVWVLGDESWSLSFALDRALLSLA
jgi:hypothetical protein